MLCKMCTILSLKFVFGHKSLCHLYKIPRLRSTQYKSHSLTVLFRAAEVRLVVEQRDPETRE